MIDVSKLGDSVIILGVGALISFFITSISAKNGTKVTVTDAIDHHEKVKHQQDVREAIRYHSAECMAPSDTRKIKLAVAFLVMKSGGNPKDYELV